MRKIIDVSANPMFDYEHGFRTYLINGIGGEHVHADNMYGEISHDDVLEKLGLQGVKISDML